MSGGAWDYAYDKIDDMICFIPGCQPYDKLIEHMRKLADVLKALEWHHSHDEELTDEQIKTLIESVTGKTK